MIGPEEKEGPFLKNKYLAAMLLVNIPSTTPALSPGHALVHATHEKKDILLGPTTTPAMA
jgi:hypothetical protein